jgi:prepilin-type N-terminal cleavage/methylation domain-containing protein
MNTSRLKLRSWADARGFTLAEMLTVLAIIILLSTIAVVSTGPFLARNRIRYAARQAQAAILQARSYAIATNSCASVVIYSGERFCVVTDSQYVPVDAPVILPEGITFRPAASHVVSSLVWSNVVGDRVAAQTAGYASQYRPFTIITFQHDGTVKFVTPLPTTARVDGAIVICIGGVSAGNIKNAIGMDENIIEVTGYGNFESRGMAVVDNEIVSYLSITYEPSGNRYVLKDVARGIYTARRKHAANSAVYSGSGGAILVVFPLTGGVVQAI